MATSLARKHSNSTDEKKSGRGRLILVSNRGPVECYLDESGRIKQRDAGGGVAVALASVARTEPVTWIASASSDTDRRLAQIGICWPLGGGSHLKLIDLPDNVYEPFYNSFCNPLLWFVQHSLAPELRCDVEEEAKAAWQSGYVPANRVFAEAVIDEIDEVGESSRIMLHDYHLYLAPRLIRDAKPDVTLQQFIHIPWPAPHSWLALPGGLVRQICDGLLANDSIAFQTDQDAANFLATCRAFLSIHASICEQRGEVRYRGRATFVRANPISVDPEELRSVAAGPDVQQYERMLAEVSDESAVIRLDRHQPSNKSLRQKSHVKTIVRVDRLDPSKNILRGFQAYGHLLKNNPKRRGRVKFLAFLVPSRSGIPRVRRLRPRGLRAR